MKYYLFALSILLSISCSAQEFIIPPGKNDKPQFDTVLVIALLSDTSQAITGSYACYLFDIEEWVPEFGGIPDSYIKYVPYYYNHLKYLSLDKAEIPKSIVVWMTIKTQ
jgi:hypothetical protein